MAAQSQAARRQETSVLASLKELRRIESDRVDQELADQQQHEQALRRRQQQAERERQLAREAEQQREQERLRLEQREERLRLAEAERRARVQAEVELEQRRLALLAPNIDQPLPRGKSTRAMVLGFVLLGGGVAALSLVQWQLARQLERVDGAQRSESTRTSDAVRRARSAEQQLAALGAQLQQLNRRWQDLANRASRARTPQEPRRSSTHGNSGRPRPGSSKGAKPPRRPLLDERCLSSDDPLGCLERDQTH